MSAAASPATRPLQLNPEFDHYSYPAAVSIDAHSGHPGHTTDQQDAIVVVFRGRLLSAEPGFKEELRASNFQGDVDSVGYRKRLDTLTLLRFLRATKWIVDDAVKKFLECEKWRAIEGIDDLPKTFDFPERPKVSEYYPQYYHKTDREGRPVYIEKLGKIDMNKLLKKSPDDPNGITTKERMFKNLFCEYEKVAESRLPACSRQADKLIETCCTIIDLAGVNISVAYKAYELVKECSDYSQKYYPERLGKMYVINAPWGFGTVWSLVKKILDPVTADKIHVLGTNYKSELLSQIPAENLPATYCGKCSCPNGCELSDVGPWQLYNESGEYQAEKTANGDSQSSKVATSTSTPVTTGSIA